MKTYGGLKMKHTTFNKLVRNIVSTIFLLLIAQPVLAQGGLDIGVLTCESVPSTRHNYIFLCFRDLAAVELMVYTYEL